MKKYTGWVKFETHHWGFVKYWRYEISQIWGKVACLYEQKYGDKNFKLPWLVPEISEKTEFWELLLGDFVSLFDIYIRKLKAQSHFLRSI